MKKCYDLKNFQKLIILLTKNNTTHIRRGSTNFYFLTDLVCCTLISQNALIAIPQPTALGLQVLYLSCLNMMEGVYWPVNKPVSDARTNLTQTDLLPDWRRGIYEDSGPNFIQIGGLELVLWIKMFFDFCFEFIFNLFFFK